MSKLTQTYWDKEYNQLDPQWNYRSEFAHKILDKYAVHSDSILEIGAGAGRTTNYLYNKGFKDITALDVDKKQLDLITNSGIKKVNKTIQEHVEDNKKYDVVLTISTLYLIPYTDDNVFEEIAKIAKKYIITIEGEKGCGRFGRLYERNYGEVFSKFGFEEIECQKDVFNMFGVLRVLKNENYNPNVAGKINNYKRNYV